MNTERFIIHLNVADFAVAVERLLDVRLRDRPVIIAPEGAVRASVYDMSEEAYRCGVRKQMALHRALSCCGEAIVLPPHLDRYEQAMQRLFKHSLPYSPLVELTDHNGHLFVDVTGTGRLFGPPHDVAWRIRNAVRSDIGFDPIWSVAPNKLMAKVATRLVKPTGELIVRAGDESDFLNPLPIHLIPGIEAQDIGCLRDMNITRTGQAARLSVNQLHVLIGRRSQIVYETLRGIDPSPVTPASQKPTTVRVDHEFGDDTNAVVKIEAALYRLTEQAGAQLRRRRLAARRAGLFVDYSDGKRSIRQAVLKPASANDFNLFQAAQLALTRAWTRRTRIRHLRLVFDRLTFPPAQLPLFADQREENRQTNDLIATMDIIRQRFGMAAVQWGRTMAA